MLILLAAKDNVGHQHSKKIVNTCNIFPPFFPSGMNIITLQRFLKNYIRKLVAMQKNHCVWNSI